MVTPIADGTVPWPAELAREYAQAGWWRGQALGTEIAAVADARPDATAMVDGTTRITYGSLLARADALASRLTDGLGLERGDRIVVQLPNCWPFAVLTLGCLRAGIVPVMALPAHRQHELAYLCQHSEARALAVPGVLRGFDHEDMADRLLAASDTLERILVAAPEVDPRHQDLTALCASPADPAAHRARWDAGQPAPSDVAVFLLSGGTTGLPKLIARTHDDYSYNARASAQLCRMDERTVYLVTLPASHNFPLACPGLLGTLLTRGPYTPRGYYRAPEQNARAFTPDGWYASGDVVRRRPDGNLVVEGRDKDMINRGGEKISAEEVENLVYRLPGIAQVAAVAAPDADLGERVCVFVVPEPGAAVTLAAIRDGMAAAGVARFKWPERLEIRAELPVTKVGKLDKKAMRDLLARA
jgi:non-ribosomal peptide synthetase component E (peptide arylation enzyme)